MSDVNSIGVKQFDIVFKQQRLRLRVCGKMDVDWYANIYYAV